MPLVVVDADYDRSDGNHDPSRDNHLSEIVDEEVACAIDEGCELVGRAEFFLSYFTAMSSRRHRMLQRAPPGRGTGNRRARALHLVFEILGRHPLEDLGPFCRAETPARF